ncbi:17340_t:CDS:2 [Acaulospora colombiana]|uniref:17340_t:CDS:1 n=1 Tax=Acaulospora colombiana TaxID=27376 RepID=A0ACA9LNR6_9GLOM|nr:17340_t:CDS:2 [Acaulospora colombiana]
MSPITRSITSPQRICNPNFPTLQDLDSAYRMSAPLIQEDAKRYLELFLDFEKVRELYNPFSEEYWFVNNTDALNQVVYYKMKRSLFIKYKQQFVKAGIELEFLRCHGSSIGCGKIGCEDINCDGAKLVDSDLENSTDDMDLFCPNSTMFNISRQSSDISSLYYQDSELTELVELSECPITTSRCDDEKIANNLVKRSARPLAPPAMQTSMAAFDRGIGFSHFDASYFLDENPCIKKDESVQTIVGDHEECLQHIRRPHQQNNKNRTRFMQDVFLHVKSQFSMSWLQNLPKEKIYYCLMVILSLSVIVFFYYSTEFGHDSALPMNRTVSDNNEMSESGYGVQKQRQKTYKILDNGKLDGAVKSQVKEFIEGEMSRIASGTPQYSSSLGAVDVDGDGLVGLVRKQLNEVLQEQLTKMMDGTSADYALYTGGARIIPHATSRDYEQWPSKGYQRLWGMLTRRNVIKSNRAETVITPSVNVGECWCFSGTEGQIAIRLSRSIVVTQITYSHISREVSIDPLSSAPKEFELWGVIDHSDDDKLATDDNGSKYWDDNNNDGASSGDNYQKQFSTQKTTRNHEFEFVKDFNLFLGKYEYDLNGRPTQVFNVPESIALKGNQRVRAIMMKVLDNHENPEFTCLYRLQVHGVLPS